VIEKISQERKRRKRNILMKEVYDLRVEMRKAESLIPLLNMAGVPISAKNLLLLNSQFGENTVFVDWIRLPQLIGDQNLAIVIYKNGTVVKVRELGITTGQVEQWVKDQLEPAGERSSSPSEDDLRPLSGATATRRLRLLDELVQPLKDCTEPGEVLVFCPTGMIHRIPLHALKVNGQVLIGRNPIAYCQSFTLLQLCLGFRLNNPIDVTHAEVLTPLKNDMGTWTKFHDVTAGLQTRLKDSNTYSKQRISEDFRKAFLLHFHGHVRFDETSPLKHYLELHNPVTQPEDILSADEIFGLELQLGSHVTVISCKSGPAKIAKGDDLLGLTAALPYAGASSVVFFIVEHP